MVKLIVIFLTFFWGESNNLIKFHKIDAEVWQPQQTITGELSGFTAKQLLVYHNQDTFSIDVTDGNKFSFNVLHRNKENKIWIVVPDGDAQHASDTLIHTLGYQPTPIIKPIATAKNDYVELRATTIENPYKTALKYLWVEDHRNPASSTIQFKEDSVANVKISSDPGTYYIIFW